MLNEPFDARKSWLSEADQQHARWRTVSLVTALRALALEGAARSRRTAMKCYLDELERRGVDGGSLLRYGMYPELLAPLASKLILAHLPAEVREGVGADVVSSVPDVALDETWSLLLQGNVQAPTATYVGSQLSIGGLQALGDALAWFMFAPVDALLDFRGPSADELDAARQAYALVTPLMEQYRWIVDRFSSTEVSGWSTSSLHSELRYQKGLTAAPCRPELMAERAVDGVQLSLEIAQRVTADEDTPTPVTPLALQMQEQARDLLLAGQPRAAAALFEFAVSQTPTDPMAHNNLGFCLIPADPRRALTALQRAESLGYRPAVVNTYNQVMCLARLGHVRDALTLADERWDAIVLELRQPSTLWTESEGALALAQVPCARTALTTLCEELAARSGQVDSRKAWMHRRAS